MRGSPKPSALSHWSAQSALHLRVHHSLSVSDLLSLQQPGPYLALQRDVVLLVIRIRIAMAHATQGQCECAGALGEDQGFGLFGRDFQGCIVESCYGALTIDHLIFLTD